MKLNRGILALLVTVLIWSSTMVVTKSALREMGPLMLTVLRFVIAFAMLGPLAHRQGFRLRMLRQPIFLRFGLTGVALYYTLQNVGLAYTSATSGTLILAIIPAATALFAMWLLGERLQARQIAGIAIAVAGTAFVALMTGSNQDAPNPLLGNLLIAGSVVAWVIYTIQGKRLNAAYPAIVTTTASIGTGLLMMLPFGIAEVWQSGLPHLSRDGGLAIFYLGVIATALPMFLWNYALQHLDASVASLYLNLVPIVGVLLAVAYGETVSVWQLLGGLLTLGGVVASGGGGKKETPGAARQSG
ncbi:MAG: DMT family transporter [Chloroflexi bacterium]|jgi:drug/metabolite transporter (DMT)-like permease|nr:DMT family transporter [Chloroflexota bacterium]